MKNIVVTTFKVVKIVLQIWQNLLPMAVAKRDRLAVGDDCPL
jgi:hypothetical protein